MSALAYDVRRTSSDRSETALELRKQVGQLLGATGRIDEAQRTFHALLADLSHIHGADNAEVAQVRALLGRLHDPAADHDS